MDDSGHAARLKATISKGLIEAQEKAITNIGEVLKTGTAEGDATWAESTVRTRVSLALVQASLAAERAQTMSQTPRQLGVVVVHARLEDTPQNRLSWEQQAAALNDSRAIEAVAVTKEPT